MPFEVIVGAPHARFGARVTFCAPPQPGAFLEAFGLGTHSWGTPNWVGLRCVPGTGLAAKAYHRAAPMSGPALPASYASRLRPVMASWHDGVREDYYRLRGEARWRDFAAACLAPLGGGSTDFAPWPRPADSAFCLSVQTRGDEWEAVTLLADDRALPDDDAVTSQWTAGLAPDDAAAYELALAAVRAGGRRPPGGWHAMASWTLDRTGGWRRAMSLRFPIPEEDYVVTG